MRRTFEHYGRLGFSVAKNAADFAILERDDIELHFALKPHHDPAHTATWVYIRVEDVDRLYEELKNTGVQDLGEPHDTDYKMREVPHIDPDGNLILFASRLMAADARNL
jgi:uncharacterized glyoxalase superfamily protein PhnB